MSADVQLLRAVVAFAMTGDEGAKAALLSRLEAVHDALDELERARVTLSRLEEHVDELAERGGGAV